MGKATYNEGEIELVISNADTISSNLTAINEEVIGYLGELDVRVYDYFTCFSDIESSSQNLGSEFSTADNFKGWMSDTYTDYGSVKTQVNEIAGVTTPELTPPPEDTPFSFTDLPAGTPEYSITSEAWNNLPEDDKKAIVKKLKQLGFTDEEIQAIIDGRAVVNKVHLDKLDTALTKLNNDGSDVRQVILDLYGFDVFNDDGTINRDKLALALIIDGKDPNDQYDLIALLKNKYGIDLFPDNVPGSGGENPVPPVGGVTPTTPDNNNNNNGGIPSNIHTGMSFGGDNANEGEETDLSEIDNLLNDGSLLDDLSDLSGSLLNGNGLGIDFNGDGSGSGAAAAGIAGVAGLGAAATSAALLLAKKKKDAILGDDDDDDDEFDDDDDDFDDDEFGEDSLDDDDFDGDAFKTNGDASDAAAALAGNDQAINKKKNWLYGLGIGLAGAGLAAGLIAKDDDEDEEEIKQELED